MSPAKAPHRRGATAVLLLPFLAFFTLVYLVPIGYAAYQSLFRTQRSGLGLAPPTTVFSGIDNYLKVLSDSAFLTGVGRVLLSGAVQLPLMLGFALLLALLLDSGAARFAKFFRLAYFLPYAIPGVIAAILWSFQYVKGISPLLDGLAALGIDAPLLKPGWVLASIGNIVTWSWTGYNMLVLYTALRAIPKELYQAAQLDGCGDLRIAWHIKIPLVRPALIMTGVFSIIGTLQLFNEPSVLKPVAAGSIDTGYTPSMLAYQAAFGANDYNIAATIAVVLALTTAVLSFTFLKLSQRGTTS